MPEEIRDIKEAFKILGETDEEKYCSICTIDSVDLVTKTAYCLPIDETKADLIGIKLLADSVTGFMIVPKVGSAVIVSFLDKGSGYISMFSQVEKIYLNGEEFGGLVKITGLVTKINTLESDLNTMKGLVSTWTPVPNDGGAALKLALLAWYQATITATTQSELENTTVVHGGGNS